MFFLVGVIVYSTTAGGILNRHCSNHIGTPFNMYNSPDEILYFVDENTTLIDGVGDVFDMVTGEIVTEHPKIDVENIDISQYMYNRSDKNVRLTLEVDGVIEDRGNISDIHGGTTHFDLVLYCMSLKTDMNSYSIIYINKVCQLIINHSEPVNLSAENYSVTGNILTVLFEVNTSIEVCDYQ